jgi:predicted ribosome quality control (RQC) complex YloA/Tae2 family protein
MRFLLITLFATVAMASPRDAYVISLGNYSTISGASVRDIELAVKRMPDKGIWVRRGGREYVIVDEKTQRQTLAVFAPQRALVPEQKAVSREESRLDDQIDELEDQDRLTAAERERLSELRARMKVVARRERELDKREEELDREAERQFWMLINDAIRSGLARPLTR